METIAPMLAKAVATVPDPDSVAGGLRYEPKWDGFRGIVTIDGDDVEIGSRGAKPLTRYFPELVEAFRARFGGREHPVVLDGEVVVRSGVPGNERLDWEALSQRIHPAASRIAKLSVETPAQFVAFDLLHLDGEDLTGRPFDERRAALEELGADLAAPLFVTRTTLDVEVAREWLTTFEGAGLDGVVAKPRSKPYEPNKRTMLKVKHHREADVVAVGYRVHKSGTGVGSLLLGLYDDAGELRMVGGVSAFTDKRRRELVDELEPLVERDADGRPVTGDGERSRFSSGRDTSFVRLAPERVLEVRYDQMEGDRFRHTVQFARWRPDREARSCGFDQLEVPTAYDLSDVLS
ncbi:ATP-dependent DNA ligase [Curtobacterium sp. MCJR17_055]|uniref:ATP-dependent DNA ligase n=1 Tax=unclassified Curtobacterium TaxID=257496 RepID=UPI000D9734EE|nr:MULTISPECIES: ATP-dependent DNA ligase [unclassified Curtobacterium]PYY32829.1 ATP-dependent DNA ligase [Curtobacterium sp. MCBD17_029]PYY54083.1 ATP-dependent DNA ligase [Curtobacterium sp. MCJR17_055]PYY55942.1 ATP-dependent DNA ligase [Curtobacterium sp. MCPF17_015]